MFKKYLLLILFVSSLFAETTMCYKENFSSPSKLEAVKLDGGFCDGKFSANEMKNIGWNTKEISTTKGEIGLNYTYIFSRENKSNTNHNISNEILKSQLYTLHQELRDKENYANINLEIENGKKIYEQKCAKCHGINGELKPYTSNKLIGMDSESFENAMRDYILHQKDNGAALLMTPYILISKETKDVKKYLESINVLIKKDNKEDK